MRTIITVIIILLYLTLFSGCGPSPEDQAATASALTAAAATNTPLPTETPLPTATITPSPTPTPVPISLNVVIQNIDGNPIEGASVRIVEFEDEPDSTQVTDSGGLVVWDDLPIESIQLSIIAPGYFSLDEATQVARGINKLTYTLEEDPFGMMISEACAQGEKLLYLDDFQDGHAQKWDEIEFKAQGWSIVQDPEDAGNFIIMAQGSPEAMVIGTTLREATFENAVWRARVKFSDNINSTFFNWRHSFEGGDVRYIINNGTQVFIDLSRFTSGNHIGVGMSNLRPVLGQWTTFEISTFGDLTQVWVDGKKLIEYTDPQVLPPGTISLEPHFEAEGQILYDDLSVCELSAPFETIFKDEE